MIRNFFLKSSSPEIYRTCITIKLKLKLYRQVAIIQRARGNQYSAEKTQIPNLIQTENTVGVNENKLEGSFEQTK